MLKKARVSVMIAALLLLLSSCGGPKPPVEEVAEFDPQEPVTICFDIDAYTDWRHYQTEAGDINAVNLNFTGAQVRESAVEQLLKEMKEQGGPENVTYEFIEGQGEDRDGALTRLRTELMSGGGPDVFVICQAEYSGNNLFKFVEKKMEENIFMPLDAYMEQAQFMDTGKMNQAVLSGGKNSAGRQMIIPLRYTFPATVFPADETDLDLSQAHTLSDMLAGTDPVLTGTLASWYDSELDYFHWGVTSVLGKRADYSKEKLLLSQEEYRELVKQLCGFVQGLEEPGTGAPENELFDFRRFGGLDKSWKKKPVTIVPLYNLEGGVTARITDFAAVNRNAQSPAGAFWVVDFISSEEQFLSSDLHMYMNSHSLPVYDDLMQESTMLPFEEDHGEGDKSKYVYFDDQDWQAVDAARSNISSAEFPSELDMEIEGLLDRVMYAPEDQRDKLIDESYRKLEMLLGES